METILDTLRELWKDFLSSHGETFGNCLVLGSLIAASLNAVLVSVVKLNVAPTVPASSELNSLNEGLLTTALPIAITAAVLGFLGHALRREGIRKSQDEKLAIFLERVKIDKLISIERGQPSRTRVFSEVEQIAREVWPKEK
ncbi:MAG: hypothetical protein GJ677_00795 [Rhodobacteraceae bacterium]|nr:hypothetical protein [Paracoccaceae bacterium]